MFHDSIIDHKIARRHLVRCINNSTISDKVYNHNELDDIKIHDQTYTIMFLNNQLWDKITYEIETPYITRQDFIRKFNLSPNESTRIYNLINIDNREYINCNIFCKFITTYFNIDELKHLYIILYCSSSSRRQKIIEKRRSSSLTKTTVQSPKPVNIEIPKPKPIHNNILPQKNKDTTYDIIKMLFCC